MFLSKKQFALVLKNGVYSLICVQFEAQYFMLRYYSSYRNRSKHMKRHQRENKIYSRPTFAFRVYSPHSFVCAFLVKYHTQYLYTHEVRCYSNLTCQNLD
jgi:hypothetical protein